MIPHKIAIKEASLMWNKKMQYTKHLQSSIIYTPRTINNVFVSYALYPVYHAYAAEKVKLWPKYCIHIRKRTNVILNNETVERRTKIKKGKLKHLGSARDELHTASIP